jgi:hypothetical protein
LSRTARCHCGGLVVEVRGEPVHRFMCHCEFCQRRTGSSYHLDAWYPAGDVTIQGETKTYSRTGYRGDDLHFHFCPTCGSNVFFEVPQALPGLVGVAVGCFVEPDFPPPQVSLYGRRKHRWLSVPEGTLAHEQGVTLDSG